MVPRVYYILTGLSFGRTGTKEGLRVTEEQSECVEWCLKMAKEMRESGREEAAWDYESLARMWDKK